MGANVTLLWVGAVAAADALLAETAREFGMTAQVCAPRDCLRLLENGLAPLVVVELDGEPSAALGLVAELRDRMPRLSILAAAGDGQVATIRSALHAGASDVLSLPLRPPELRKALVRYTEPGAPAREQGEVITICGARGGLGATTIAVNLAFELRAWGKVALVDLDLQRGDVAAFLNLAPLNSLATIATAPTVVDKAFLEGTLTRHPGDVSVLAAPPKIDDAETIGRDDVTVALRLLRTQFRWTIVDMARTLTGATLAAIGQSQRVFVLTDLSVPGVRAAGRLVALLTHLITPLQRVDLLVTESVRGPVSPKAASHAIGKPVLLLVPRDGAAAAAAMNAGVPLSGNGSALATALAELAAKVAGVERPTRTRAGRLLRQMFSANGGSNR
jgi:pilus assembly protein CpaE